MSDEKEQKELRCPKCGGEVGWDLQDRYELDGVIFSERILRCAEIGGCWIGPVALFPWDGFKDKAKYSRWC